MPETTEAVAGAIAALATALGVATPAGAAVTTGVVTPVGVEEAAGSAGASSFGNAADADSCGAPGAGVAPDSLPPVLPPVSCGIAGAITAATVVGGVGAPPTVGRRGVTTGVAAGVVTTGAGVVTTGAGAGAVVGGVKSETVHRVGEPATSTQLPVPPVPPAAAGDAVDKATAITAVATRMIFLMSFCPFVWFGEKKAALPLLYWFVITNGLAPRMPLAPLTRPGNGQRENPVLRAKGLVLLSCGVRVGHQQTGAGSECLSAGHSRASPSLTLFCGAQKHADEET